ncbi:phosphonate metabolism protein/1,5-bisphosphokinase (PRPP-forming) PhnN [Chachezhania antarctica]|uniref:phosphonate metabolism protein/1,5-bisphosphokinase (PRPP-forming) PhnN n=1 Tax=Chachezhania antarctica TaxID=2340860 RepID=UPI000EB33C61|nr:phosphonate metabolism protein/1,5-bisphosphokinase (PRPP-forming) PhnN [Chachezhania antarctica]|tara:strand:- start:3525 stop:4082 length:558 start_codon:yes stop_codon:yes gene_type:complete
MTDAAPLAPVIAIVGPSGVGKDSVMEAIKARDSGFVTVRRVITRAADAGGEDFDAVPVDTFQQMETDGAFALSWQAHGLHYGIPAGIDEMRRTATGVLVNLSRAVLPRAEDRFGTLIVLALEADQDVLAQRLAQRGREDEAGRAKRLGRAMDLPEGLSRVHRIDNSGPLENAVRAALAALHPERA